VSSTRLSRLALIVFLACLLGNVWAQDSGHPKAEPSDASAASSSADPNGGVAKILEGVSERAASTSEKWGSKVGLGHDASFAISIAFNFAVIAFLCYLLVKSKLLQLFRDRTQTIQKGIREAQAASAEATRRLSDIEARLARLDTEVAEIRTSAESEAVAEEARISQAAEDDKRKILESVETEISAIARNARRELKTYAATLAVDLASRKIRVDESTDHALVRDFVGQLGKDGK
jgi:F-type H+-transporting ATPase subunit b